MCGYHRGKPHRPFASGQRFKKATLTRSSWRDSLPASALATHCSEMAARNFGEGLAGATEGLAKAFASYGFHTQLSTKIDEALAATEYKENEGTGVHALPGTGGFAGHVLFTHHLCTRD